MQRRLANRLTLWFLLSFLTPLVSAQASAPAGPATLRILSFNVKGLPTTINPYFSHDRFAEIGRRLAQRRAQGTAPDVVVIQEAFGPHTMDIEKFSGYPYVVYGPRASTLDDHGYFKKPFGSGLIILSRYPLSKARRLSFNRYVCSTWDCFAAKGVVGVELEVPGLADPIQLMTTHMQSAPSFFDDKVRIAQFKELAQFMTPLFPVAGALIVAGDFNTNPSKPSYAYWKSYSGLQNEGEACRQQGANCEILGGTDPLGVYERSDDQIFFNDGQSIALRVRSVERNFSEPFNGKPLSDHLGLEAVFTLQAKR